MEFEWDPRKARENESKHGVTFDQAKLAFDDPNLVLAEDEDHSGAEQRYFAFGKVAGGIMTVRFTVRANGCASSALGTGAEARCSMAKRIVYEDEPIKIGRRVGREILPAHGGPRAGAGRPPSGNKPVTLRLPPKLIEAVRRDAKRAGQTVSEFVARKLGAS